MPVLLNNNKIKLNSVDLSVPLKDFFSQKPDLAVVDLSPVHRYEKGERTDIVEAFRYTLTDLASGAQLTVKVPGAAPVITQEDLEAAEGPVRVSIDLARTRVTPYAIEFGVATVSITAPDIALLKA